MTRKQFIAALDAAGISYDKVVAHKDGSIEFRNGYFYHHREFDARQLEEAQAAFPGAEFKQHDHFASWPKESWIATVVHFNPAATLSPLEKAEGCKGCGAASDLDCMSCKYADLGGK